MNDLSVLVIAIIMILYLYKENKRRYHEINLLH